MGTKKPKGEPGGEEGEGRGSEEWYVTYDNMLPSDKDDKGQDKSWAEGAVAPPARRARPTPANTTVAPLGGTRSIFYSQSAWLPFYYQPL